MLRRMGRLVPPGRATGGHCVLQVCQVRIRTFKACAWQSVVVQGNLLSDSEAP